jgi:hypothetical protein
MDVPKLTLVSRCLNLWNYLDNWVQLYVAFE